MSKFKPCPFCGCSAPPAVQGNGIGDNWLECTECGASTRLREDGAGSEKDWNRRAARATAEQRSLGDVTGAMYRCRRCGETSEIQFNFATLPKEEPCCRQRPCVRSGTGPCDMPARDTKLSATHQSLLVRLAALKRYRNKLKSTGEPSGNYATLSVPIVLLEAIDAAIESQRSGKSNG